MQKKLTIKTVAMALAIAASPVVIAQPSSPYFQAVTNLNPAGYWPLNEIVQPPAPFASNYVAANSGSLGTAGNGYYGVWYATNGDSFYVTNNVNQTNGVTSPNDGDKAMWNSTPQSGQYVVVP
ncbi:MAG TPA: hypothetical protein VGN61_01790, partial [Verrucomicrobiae bacterium]